MGIEGWTRLEDLFSRALERSPAELAGFLDENCAGEGGLREELAAMLAAHAPEARLEIEARLLAPDAAPETPADPLLGTRVGRYRLVRAIGRGGMGEVYLAERNGDYRQQVAVKLVRTGVFETPEVVSRFRKERQILARLAHPHIAQILDGGTTADGRPYLVMEYVDGEPITDYCDARRLSIRERLRLFGTVCSAVQFAHRNLVVHRDLKPSNILVIEEREDVPGAAAAGCVKLLDFGIAKLLDPAGEAGSQTSSELRLMTPEHAAPEQVRGEAITTATDVYALGVLVYELLTGCRPFDRNGRSRPELERAICQREPVAPSTAANRAATTSDDGTPDPSGPEARAAVRGVTAGRLQRLLRGDLDNIVLKALRKEPERRYATAQQLAEDVERALDGRPVVARRGGVAYRLEKFVRRHAWGVAAWATLVLLLIGFLAVTFLQSRAVARERDRAHAERDTAEQVAEVLIELFELSNPTRTPAGRSMPMGELLDLYAERVIRGLEGQPAVQARLRHVLGKLYREHSRFDRARPLLEAALAQQRSLTGIDAPDAASIYHDLAMLIARTEDPEGAVPMVRKSLERHRRLFGAEHEKVAQCMQDLASLAPIANPERRELLVGALEMRQRLLPELHVDIASSLNDLAIFHRDVDQHHEADRLFRQALAILREVKGEEHPFTLTVMTNQAAQLGTMGRLADSEAHQREALAGQRRAFGPESAAVAYSLNNLGVLLILQRDYAGAEAVFREARDLWIRLLGVDHRLVANTTRNLGHSLELQGRDEEALAWLRQAVEIAAGKDPLVVTYMEGQVATVLRRLGHTREALAALQEVVRRLRDLKPEGHFYVADAQVWLADAYLGSGAPQEAEILYRESLRYRESYLDEDHAKVAEARCGLGRALAAEGRWEEAAPLLERGFQAYSRWGRAHRDTVEATRRTLAQTVAALYSAPAPSA